MVSAIVYLIVGLVTTLYVEKVLVEQGFGNNLGLALSFGDRIKSIILWPIFTGPYIVSFVGAILQEIKSTFEGMINNKLEIQLEPLQRILFTADTHFGHKNVIGFCNRPYETVAEMQKGLIENWNRVVSDQDIVFHLGDFSWWDSNTEIKKICSKLKGKQIYLVPGNHDLEKGWREVPDRVTILNSVTQLWVRDQETKALIFECILSHYPLMTWNKRETGVPNLHGHLHGCKGEGRDGGINPDANLPYHWNQIDVGVDCWNYEPVELTAIEVALDLKENSQAR